MAYSDFPTAKENMDSGKWIYAKYYEKGIMGIHYYINKLENNKYRVHYMHCSSILGVPFLILLQFLCIVLCKLFNMINKGMGDSIFKELITEIKELLQARKHKLSTGHSFQVGSWFNSLDECNVAIEKEIIKIKENK